MSINERIKEIRQHYFNGNNEEFAKSIGKSKQYASNICNNKNVGPDLQDEILSFFPEINEVWLKLGIGSMFKSGLSMVSEPQSEYNEHHQSSDGVFISNKVFEQISRLTEAVLSQQRTIEMLTEKKIHTS